MSDDSQSERVHRTMDNYAIGIFGYACIIAWFGFVAMALGVDIPFDPLELVALAIMTSVTIYIVGSFVWTLAFYADHNWQKPGTCG